MPNRVPPHKLMDEPCDGCSARRHAQGSHQGSSRLSGSSGSNWKGKVPSYTYDTIRLLMEKEAITMNFSFIIGGDMIEYLPKWYEIDELLQNMATFIGVNRPCIPLNFLMRLRHWSSRYRYFFFVHSEILQKRKRSYRYLGSG